MLIKALAAAAGNFGGEYTIDNSLRFNDNDSAYLSRTPATAGNRKTWTWSGWVKRGNLGDNYLFTTTDANINEAMFLFFGADNLRYWDSKQGSQGVVLQSNAVFRDVSGWYHIVLMVDREAATPADRAKLYVNGEELSYSATSYPNQNENSFVNATETHYISADPNYFDGYLAEINFIDGQALTPDDFGEINATTGEWSPKRYAGTYGTNGFYLPFDGNANDDSGNGNNWTENNLASTDYMISTPTNVFSVLNPLSVPAVGTLQEGNLETNVNTAANWAIRRATIAPTTGKWYCEFYLTSVSDDIEFGVVDVSVPSTTLRPASGQTSLYALKSTNADRTYLDAVEQANLGSPDFADAGNIVSMAYDIDAGTVDFYVNNTLRTSTTMSDFEPVVQLALIGTTSAVLNFGQDSSFAGNKTRQGNTDANGKGDFYYEPPAGGYLALCTDNLPAPAIVQPETQFKTVLYTGNSADRNIDLGFEADFVWIRRREIESQNCLFDSVRGNGKFLFSNLTNAEFNGVNDGIHFDYANGFNIDVGANVSYYNETGGSYVAWCWKAGGTAVSNTDGSITSQVSANVDSGFSVVSYTGTGANATVGHGLSSAPEMMLVKDRDSTFTWRVYHASLANTQVLYLSATAEATTETATWNSTSPTSTVLSLGTSGGTNGSSLNYIAYAFHSVEGFSKFGSYVGNGSSTNGPFVYTGFKPAFVMIKRTDSTQNWPIVDTSRDTYNIANKRLFANLSNAEDTGIPNYLDLLSNGFKCRDGNVSYNALGGTYIYMAFAEHPFNYATGR
jgi:hypothetical protein